MDADRLTFACATAAELRGAPRRASARRWSGSARANGVPDGPLVSFGLAGGLRDDLAVGTVSTRRASSTRTARCSGRASRSASPGAEPGDDPRGRPDRRRSAERAACTSATGADAVDLESRPARRHRPARGMPARGERHA